MLSDGLICFFMRFNRVKLNRFARFRRKLLVPFTPRVHVRYNMNKIFELTLPKQPQPQRSPNRNGPSQYLSPISVYPITSLQNKIITNNNIANSNNSIPYLFSHSAIHLYPIPQPHLLSLTPRCVKTVLSMIRGRATNID